MSKISELPIAVGTIKRNFPAKFFLSRRICLINCSKPILSGAFNGKLNVVGAGSGSTTIDGNNASRIFDTGWTTAGMAFTDITLTKGNAGASADGGCVWMKNQPITVTNSVFSYCQARRGGAIFSDQII